MIIMSTISVRKRIPAEIEEVEKERTYRTTIFNNGVNRTFIMDMNRQNALSTDRITAYSYDIRETSTLMDSEMVRNRLYPTYIFAASKIEFDHEVGRAMGNYIKLILETDERGLFDSIRALLRMAPKPKISYLIEDHRREIPLRVE